MLGSIPFLIAFLTFVKRIYASVRSLYSEFINRNVDVIKFIAHHLLYHLSNSTLNNGSQRLPRQKHSEISSWNLHKNKTFR
jgi:hypothetical protein